MGSDMSEMTVAEMQSKLAAEEERADKECRDEVQKVLDRYGRAIVGVPFIENGLIVARTMIVKKPNS